MRGEILGLDASLTGTALWLLDEGRGTKLDTGDAKGLERLTMLRAALYEEVEGRDIWAVVIEGYSFGSVSKAHSIGEWGGVLRVSLCDYLDGLEWIVVVPPSTLKKFVIGHAKAGESGKDVMMLKTFKRWDIEITDNDMCDAHGLAKAGEVLFRGAGTDKDRETLGKSSKQCVSGV